MLDEIFKFFLRKGLRGLHHSARVMRHSKKLRLPLHGRYQSQITSYGNSDAETE